MLRVYGLLKATDPIRHMPQRSMRSQQTPIALIV